MADVGRTLDIEPNVSLPRLAEAARGLGEAVEGILRHLEKRALSSSRNVHRLLTVGWSAWPEEIQNEILIHFLQRGSLEPTDATLTALKRLLLLPVGRWRPLGGNVWRVYRERDGLSLVRSVKEIRAAVRLRPGAAQRIPGGTIRISKPRGVPKDLKTPPHIAWVDLQSVKAGLEARLWRPADRMMPLGMAASRKVSDLLTDRKVPAYRKRSIPVVVSGRRIVWVCGVGLDDRSKVRPETTTVLQFSYQSNV